MKEKLNPLLRSTEESTVNQNSFGVLSICILKTFVKQEKQILPQFDHFFFFCISGKVGSAH